jgi:NADH:ubiquinone oxidoreductase subunit 4 (subunit M)
MLWLLGGFGLLSMVTQPLAAAVWTGWLMLVALLYGGGYGVERYAWPLAAGILALVGAYGLDMPLLFLLSAAVAMPLFPVQHWYVGLYRPALGADGALVAALLPGAGALLLWSSEIRELPIAVFAWLALWFVVSALYGAVKALVQVQVSNLIAYAALVPAALVTIGVTTPEPLAQAGGQLQALSNTLVLGGLLLLVSRLYAGPNISPAFSSLGGLASCTPRLAVTWAIFLFALMALPGAGGFASHFLVLYGVSAQFPWLTFIGVVSLAMVAVYCLRALHGLTFGPPQPLSERQVELEGRALVGFGTLIVADATIGIAPHWVITMVS